MKTSFHLSTLINGVLAEEAKAWFDKIQKAGHQPDERTYYSLVRGCFSRNIPKVIGTCSVIIPAEMALT